jgi:hypothetical protein
MTFTWVLIAGLRTFGARMTPEQEDDWCSVWGSIGRLMGIREDLVPADVEESQVLFETLLPRLRGRTADGVNMTAALLNLIHDSVPGPLFHGLGATMMRELSGDPICDLLDVPRPNFTRLFYRLLQGVTWTSQGLGGSWDPAARLLRSFNVQLIDAFIRKGMDGAAITFTPEQELQSIQQGKRLRGIPAELHDHWTRNVPLRRDVRIKPAPIAPAFA